MREVRPAVGGPSEYEAVTKIIIDCPNDKCQGDLIDTIEKKQRRRWDEAWQAE